jgi:hypothetical protein
MKKCHSKSSDGRGNCEDLRSKSSAQKVTQTFKFEENELKRLAVWEIGGRKRTLIIPSKIERVCFQI